MGDNRDNQADQIFNQWRRFCTGGELNPEVVRPLIRESWKRSRHNKVDPKSLKISRISDDSLSVLLKKHRRLLRIASPVIEHLFSFIRGSRSIIILADEAGIILSRTGDPEYLTHSSHYEPGIEYSERSVGTNGIGTCLAIEDPVQIWGAEHYAERNHRLCCSAAPIHAPDGKLLGCLNLSCLLPLGHSHTLAMVAAAAGAIERQIRIEGVLEKKVDLLREKQTILELINDGLVSLDHEGRITEINGRGRKMLGVAPGRGIGERLETYILSGLDFTQISGSNRSIHDRDATLKLKNGILPCTISATPITEGKGLIITLREARRVRNMVNRYAGARAVFNYGDIVGSSPQIREAVRLAEIAGRSEANTLILGESGTGKEIFAQSIHNGSERQSGPFIAINCGALPRDLIQSELFGYVSGAFTGASRQGNPGKFELADGGTIFLDEIGEMPTSAQVNLLRVVENKEVIRVGDQFARPVDVRIIAATNRSLLHAIDEGTFREDLYYRLNILTINLPPLRLRSGDLEVLTNHFLDKICRARSMAVPEMDPEVVQAFCDYSWPGNIRQLENVIERAVYICREGRIRLDDIEREIRQCSTSGSLTLQPDYGSIRSARLPVPPKTRLNEVEREAVFQVLKKHRGNVRKSAQELGLARSSLYERVKKYHFDLSSLRNSKPDME